MKKSLLVAVVGLLVLAFAASMVFAATPTNVPSFACNQANLTDEQKQELAPLFNQMTDLRKQMFEVKKQVIQKQVEFGNLTQEQADQRIAWMKERIDQGFPGPGMMNKGPGMMRGGPGFGPMWQQQNNK
ncbi:MAG: DUF2680 domain-containing protein [Veillonellales bacterium]